MTTITLEVPDELAMQIFPLRDRMPDLLAKWLRTESSPPKRPDNGKATTAPLYPEIVDFLASEPAPEQLTAFRISPEANLRLEDLLDKNREEGLTAAETWELDAYLQARDLLILLKADAHTLADLDCSPTFTAKRI
jgi:hypothetical protein